jgi:hypothetical protein
MAVVMLAFAVIRSPAATTRYVDVNGTNPVSPYTSWATAATNIQNAVDASAAGDLILVTNGIYQTGGRVVYGSLTNRVVVNKAVTVQSINGPANTMIRGVHSGAVRCVYLTNGACLSGFTLTNGATRNAGDSYLEQSGGGIWCESGGATITNCTVAGNTANFLGGGVYYGRLYNCTLTGNSATYGGGAEASMLTSCSLTANSVSQSAGGADASALYNCQLTGNSATLYGGGAEGSTIENCILMGNSASQFGGGAYNCTLVNCSLTGNSAPEGGGAYNGMLYNCTLTANSASSSGGGAFGATLNDCIVYFNTSSILYPNYRNGSLNYCCTTPLPSGGTGNITNAPLFVDQIGGNLRLQTNSPCINAGNNLDVTVTNDLDGRPRIIGGTVDIGAYEFQGSNLSEFIGWLQQYGLPTDGSVDFLDLDGTGMNNWQKWIAGLNPTNPASVLAMSPPQAANNYSGITVTWQSVNTRIYYLQSSTNLAALPAFSSIHSNIVGQAGTTSYTDTTATNNGPYFYRVGVQ